MQKQLKIPESRAWRILRALCRDTDHDPDCILSGRTDAAVEAISEFAHGELEVGLAALKSVAQSGELAPNESWVIDLILAAEHCGR